MPRYVYECKSCGEVIEVTHSMTERRKDCERCETKGSLRRIPSIPKVIKKKTEEELREAKEKKSLEDRMKEEADLTKKDLDRFKKELMEKNRQLFLED